MAAPKATSFEYGTAYQQRQLEKFHARATNHWRHRIDLADRLVNEWAQPRLGKQPSDIVLVDVGCSIGTFAIEFARRGFDSYGIDFDESAISIAAELARSEGVSARFMRGDVADWSLSRKIDIALCFDIFEHLHDDELGALLVGVRKNLAERGCLVFHTYPTELDYLFYDPWYRSLPMIPFAWLPPGPFARMARLYALAVDAALVALTGETWRERQRTASHCNLLSASRLEAMLKRTGYDLVFIETDNLYSADARTSRWFGKHRVAHRNLYGVAVSKSP